MRVISFITQILSVLSVPIPNSVSDIMPQKPVAINYLNLGLASTNDYPVYQVPDTEIVYVAIPKPIGANQDEGGCCISCGYNWCPSINNCVRPWETYCQELDFPYNALYKGSGIIMPPTDPEQPQKNLY